MLPRSCSSLILLTIRQWTLTAEVVEWSSGPRLIMIMNYPPEYVDFDVYVRLAPTTWNSTSMLLEYDSQQPPQVTHGGAFHLDMHSGRISKRLWADRKLAGNPSTRPPVVSVLVNHTSLLCSGIVHMRNLDFRHKATLWPCNVWNHCCHGGLTEAKQAEYRGSLAHDMPLVV